MSRSSTSSSDTDRGDAAEQSPVEPADDPGATDSSASGRRALLLCLGLLLLLEFGAARRDWLWQLDPRRPVGIFLEVEDRIVDPADDVRVVILGSSVMRDAVLPRELERRAGLPAGSVLNTSLPNATPFDFVLMYERNREVFRGARLIIVGIEEWFFYEEPGISERYHRWAGFSDRLADHQGSDRLRVLVSWAWKTYAARQAFAVDGLSAAASGNRAEVIGDDGRTRWRPEEQDMGPEDFSLTSYRDRLAERVPVDRQVRYLQILKEMTAADGVPLLVVRMPMRAAAFEVRAEVDPEAEIRMQTLLRDALGEVAGATLRDLPTGGDVGIADRYFLDERHFATAGAELFTQSLASVVATYPVR